jgi:putative solute:sodium symporter small subunit
MTSKEEQQRAYWRANIKLVLGLLVVWFVVSFGLGIVFVRPLNTIKMGGFPLGFWFAQQGAIYVFIVLILVYARMMERLDKQYGVDERDETDTTQPEGDNQ